MLFCYHVNCYYYSPNCYYLIVLSHISDYNFILERVRECSNFYTTKCKSNQLARGLESRFSELITSVLILFSSCTEKSSVRKILNLIQRGSALLGCWYLDTCQHLITLVCRTSYIILGTGWEQPRNILRYISVLSPLIYHNLQMMEPTLSLPDYWWEEKLNTQSSTTLTIYDTIWLSWPIDFLAILKLLLFVNIMFLPRHQTLEPDQQSNPRVLQCPQITGSEVFKKVVKYYKE